MEGCQDGRARTSRMTRCHFMLPSGGKRLAPVSCSFARRLCSCVLSTEGISNIVSTRDSVAIRAGHLVLCRLLVLMQMLTHARLTGMQI